MYVRHMGKFGNSLGGIFVECWESAYIAGIIDGEGSISLTRMHPNEHRRPCITIASTDRELLIYLQTLTGGTINNKKNYDPVRHKDSYTLNIKKKEDVLSILKQISPYLRVEKKRNRAQWILMNYEKVTPRNGKYNPQLLKQKIAFEDAFFNK
jgi:intein-encoded DNA endonuclease-like protein